MPINLPIKVELIPETDKAKRKIQKDLSQAKVDINAQSEQKPEKANILSTIGNGLTKIIGWLGIIAGLMLALKPLLALVEILTQAIAVALMPIVVALARMLMPVVVFIMKLMVRWNKWFDKYFNRQKSEKQKIEKTAREKAIEKVSSKYNIPRQEAIENYADEIEKTAKQLSEKMKAWYDLTHLDMKDIMLGPIGTLADALKLGWAYIKSAFNIDTNALRQAFASFINNVNAISSSFVSSINANLSSFIANIGIVLSSTISNISATFGSWIKGIANSLSAIKDRISKLWDNFISSVKSAINSIINRIKNIRIPRISLPSIPFIGKRVGDVIITKTGRIYETSPDDNIIATKSQTFNQPRNINVTININGSVDNNTIDRLKRELRSELLRVGRW